MNPLDPLRAENVARQHVVEIIMAIRGRSSKNPRRLRSRLAGMSLVRLRSIRSDLTR